MEFGPVKRLRKGREGMDSNRRFWDRTASFSVMEQTLLPGDPLPECFVAAKLPPQGRG